MCCTWLAENTGRKNDAKNRHLGTIPQLCRAISSQLRHVSTIGSKRPASADRTASRQFQAQNHASPERCHKSFTMIFLGDHDFPLTGSNFGNLTAFRAIFGHTFTAHAQERPLMNFRLKFWHHRSIPWSRFPYRAIRGRFLLIFALDKLNICHISTSALVDLLI